MPDSLAIQTRTEPPDGWMALATELGAFYHLPPWIDGIAKLFRYRCYWITATEGGRLVGILPLAMVPSLGAKPRLVSFPFSFAAGPVAQSAEGIEQLVAAAVQLATDLRVARLEIKWNEPCPAHRQFVRIVRYQSYPISTSGGVDAVWNQLHPDSTRRGIRKAERSGVRVERGESTSDWHTMAELQLRTSHQHGTPAPPVSFFTTLCRSLQERGLADLWLARRGEHNAPMAGLVVWKGSKEWIYSFGASDPAALEFRPNHMLLWTAIRTAVEAGAGFNLGRASRDQAGLVQFKKRWAGQAVDLPYDYWPSPGGLNVQPRAGGTLGLASHIWRRLPEPIAAWGSWLYRYLG